jgi:hypothetical protein
MYKLEIKAETKDDLLSELARMPGMIEDGAIGSAVTGVSWRLEKEAA